MEKLLEIFTPLHKGFKRDYLGRMLDDKVHCMGIAKKFGKDFWDGERRYGYGGYKYDGRWADVAKKFIDIYDLQDNSRVLDVGCGKGFLLYEFQRLLPRGQFSGFDISNYAIENSKEEIRSKLFIHPAQEPYPFEDKSFDLVLSMTTLHNLPIDGIKTALQEIERVGKEKYVVVEGFRNDKELFNLQCWALTCQAFLSPEEWKWLFKESRYTGDYEFIYHE